MLRLAGNKPRTSERGTVLLMATVTILVVVGMLALAVDVGYLMNGRGQLQNIVDASALAGAHGLRTAIEPNGATAQQTQIVRSLARDFALFNPLRAANGTTGLNLSDEDISIVYPADYPIHPARVTVKHRTALPTIFGSVFGLTSMNVSAVAIASTGVVDGGTGMVSGCWRPILIPDTFYDKNGNAWAVCGETRVPFIDGTVSPSRPRSQIDTNCSTNPNNCNLDPSLALQPGDYYISRFASTNASSTRNETTNFLQAWESATPVGAATSIRDTNNLAELKSAGGKYLIGQRIFLRREDWQIVNFAASGITGDFPTDPVQQINRGCCTPIRVGEFVKVYAPGENTAIYNSFIQELHTWFNGLVGLSGLSSPNVNQYKYAQTQNYPTPNANPRVIPVLMCSPIQFSDSRNAGQFFVTNIGAFFLEQVSPDGSLVGFFVREMVTGGLPLEPQNQVDNASLLPVSVQLVR